MSEAWRALPDSARQKYFDMAEAAERAKDAAQAAGRGQVGASSSSSGGDATAGAAAGGKTNKVQTEQAAVPAAAAAPGDSPSDGPPVLREIRKFENLAMLARIFGPASMIRIVGSMLTPSGRVKVKHFVKGPVMLKYDGGARELTIGFSVGAEFKRRV